MEGRDSSELFALAEQVEDLQRHPGWATVMDFVSRGREGVIEALINGPTRDQADYARTTGYAAGLDEIRNVPAAILKAAESRQAKLEAQAAAEGTGGAEEET